MAPREKRADPRPTPRLYLVTPPLAETASFAASLGTALEAGDCAAVLLRLADADERSLINRAKSLMPVVQDRGAALLIDGRVDIVARAGADGVHRHGLADFSEAIERLKPERIVGVGGITSRHDTMVAAEQGADYIMFGEPGESGGRPGFAAIEERVAWWAELFEIPCVGYAASPDEVAPLAAAGADFVALGDWLWRDGNSIAARVHAAAAALRLPESIA
jgi:thiamine-phosphate pyrophosphorylase